MKTKIKINSVFGKLLFEYECEENTIKKTLLEAIKNNANLSDADLRNADLRNANLWNADLRNADLWNANLWNADLSGADLSGANLSDADLSDADLSDANLWNAKNMEKTIKLPMYCKWSVGITGDKIHIGCEKRTIKEWDEFFKSDEVIETERNTKEFKQIQAVYEAYKSYYNFLNNDNN